MEEPFAPFLRRSRTDVRRRDTSATSTPTRCEWVPAVARCGTEVADRHDPHGHRGPNPEPPPGHHARHSATTSALDRRVRRRNREYHSSCRCRLPSRSSAGFARGWAPRARQAYVQPEGTGAFTAECRVTPKARRVTGLEAGPLCRDGCRLTPPLARARNDRLAGEDAHAGTKPHLSGRWFPPTTPDACSAGAAFRKEAEASTELDETFVPTKEDADTAQASSYPSPGNTSWEQSVLSRR